MAIEIKCNCGLDYRLDDSRAGELFKCRLCGAEMYLPAKVGRASPNSPVTKARSQNTSPPNAPEATEIDGEDIDWSNFNAEPFDEVDEKPSAAEHRAPPIAKAASSKPIIKKDDDEKSHRLPPAGWWFIRAVMLLICISFIFAPWLKLSIFNPASGKRESEHITGWNMAMSVVDEIRYTGDIHPAAAAPILESYADPTVGDRDSHLVVAGGRMMALGAAVFLAGIIAVPVAGLLVLLAGPRVMALPFAACLLSLISFTAGWFTAMSAEPMRVLLETMHARGCYMGISASIYFMLPILALLSLRAGIRPDYKLLQAIQWSRQRNESGS